MNILFMYTKYQTLRKRTRALATEMVLVANWGQPMKHRCIYNECRTGASPIEHRCIYKKYRTGASPTNHTTQHGEHHVAHSTLAAADHAGVGLHHGRVDEREIMEQGIYFQLSLARPPPTKREPRNPALALCLSRKPSPGFMFVTKKSALALCLLRKPSPDFVLATTPTPGIDTYHKTEAPVSYLIRNKALTLNISQNQALAMNMHTMCIDCNEMNAFVAVHHWSIDVKQLA
jgi:hypothetical protein